MIFLDVKKKSRKTAENIYFSVIECFYIQLIWLNPRKTLISTDDSRYIDDSRMSIERPKVPDWNLMIREVRFNDSGEYMCQVNTVPVRIRRVYLFVKGKVYAKIPTVFRIKWILKCTYIRKRSICHKFSNVNILIENIAFILN